MLYEVITNSDGLAFRGAKHGLNGYDATRRLKQDPRTRQIPVIALTASAMSQNVHESTALCDGYLRKLIRDCL